MEGYAMKTFKRMNLRFPGCRALGVAVVLCVVAESGAAYRRGMTMIKPSEQWREALPSGNGEIGALVYGSINEERVLFNHNELWYGGSVDEVPDMSAELPVVRKLLLEGNYLEANDHYSKQMRAKGFNARNAIYHPAFDLLLVSDCDRMFEDYSRTLDFETGEAEVTWRDGETRHSRRLFVSIPDDLSVMTVRAGKKGAVQGSVTLDIHDLKDAIQQNGDPFDPGFTYKTVVDGDFIEFRADGSDGGEFGGVMHVVAKGGALDADKETLRFSGADEVVLVIGFFANEESQTAVPRLKKKLAAAGSDYEKLFERHAVLHRQKFNSMGVRLNLTDKRDTPNEILLLDAYQNPASAELVEKLFDYGRYLLISSNRAKGYPAGLQGIWNGDYRPPWSGLYGINENLQMTYWQALPGNMQESMMAFYDYFDSHLDEFRYNAKQLWGCDGIYIPPFMSPDSGIMRHTAPHVVYWTDAAGWLASFYYDYYLFTGDEEFLKNRAVPFMKEVALFYEDYIVKDEQGKNMLLPSQSPENQPADKMIKDAKTGREKRIKVQINSTIAVAISKEVFHNLVEACETLGIEKDGVKRWKAMLADMPEYQVNEDGALREWLHPDFKDNYEHRHQSHLYPLFPGQEITEESDRALYDACRVAIEKRLVIGLQSQTGWSLAHMANVYARLGDGDKAKEALNILARCCLGQNLFTYHNDWRKMGATLPFYWGRTAPFQMDANFGVPAAIMEMLCSSTPDMLRVLPALPSDWSAGEFHDVLTRTGVRASARWDMDEMVVDLTLSAGRDAVFDLKLPREILEITSTRPQACGDSGHGNRYRSVKLAKGEQVQLRIKLK
jgi:alpha-L-fucosidase 2